MDAPTTRDHLDEMIRNKVQENVHLDYKDSRALDDSRIKEVAKDVSAFANSDGGLIIYGLQENGHLPIAVDGGVDHIRFSRERLEHIISGNISPRIADVRIYPIPLSADRSAYSVKIPKSSRGPHQSNIDKRYYKRHNFESVPMADYEINDILLRTISVPPLISIEPVLRHRVMAYLSIENVGTVSAQNVEFSFDRQLKWNNGDDMPPILRRGLQVLSLRRRFEIFYGGFIELVNQQDRPLEFFATVSYLQPTLSARLTDTFYINFEDFLNTSMPDSDLEQHGAKVEKALQDLTSQVKRLTELVEALGTIAGPSGLDLSTTSIRNLLHVLAVDGAIERRDPSWKGSDFFREVLNVDPDLARELEVFFRRRHEDAKLSEIPGVDEELLARMQALLKLDNFK